MYAQRCMPGRSRRRSQDRDNERLDGRHHLWLGFLYLPTTPPPNETNTIRGDPFFPSLRHFSPKRTNPAEKKRDAPHRVAFVSCLYLAQEGEDRRGAREGEGDKIRSNRRKPSVDRAAAAAQKQQEAGGEGGWRWRIARRRSTTTCSRWC